jgi:hypothetical protein
METTYACSILSKAPLFKASALHNNRDGVDSSRSESSSPLLPEQQAFHQHLRALAQSAVRTVLELVMREELDAFIGAAWGECSPKRKGLLTVALFESYHRLSSSFFATGFVRDKKNSIKKRSQTVRSEH